MLRSDLRSVLDLRPFTAEIGLVSEADGSALISVGNTKVLVSVFGPAPPKYARHEQYNQATVEIEIDIPNRLVIDGSDIMQQKRKYERFIKDSIMESIDLRQFPRMVILVNILVINNDGSLLSVALNSAVLALVDAGIPLVYVPVAVSLSVVQKDNLTELILDPVSNEEEHSIANGTFVLRPLLGQLESNATSATAAVIASDLVGRISTKGLKDAAALAMATSSQLNEIMQKFIQTKLNQNV